jgi:hypothetical protein
MFGWAFDIMSGVFGALSDGEKVVLYIFRWKFSRCFVSNIFAATSKNKTFAYGG